MPKKGDNRTSVGTATAQIRTSVFQFFSDSCTHGQKFMYIWWVQNPEKYGSQFWKFHPSISSLLHINKQLCKHLALEHAHRMSYFFDAIFRVASLETYFGHFGYVRLTTRWGQLTSDAKLKMGAASDPCRAKFFSMICVSFIRLSSSSHSVVLLRCSSFSCVMTPPPGNDDLSLRPTGRARGQPNFRADEDVMLASSYVIVSTNAAVGTDQNASTFWEKIRVAFVQSGGAHGRNACSLQNRYNKVLQAEVNKYLGIFMSTLREYHSGWVLADYVNDAKRKFLVKTGKPFRHELVYDVLKKSLPKFQINKTQIDARVQRALFFCDNDVGNAAPVEEEQNGDEDAVVLAHVVPEAADVIGGMCTPRPNIGKKKAKALEHNRKQQLKKPKIEAASKNDDVITRRSNALESLVAAAKHKNDLVEQQLMFQHFMRNPDSAESAEYFTAMSKKYKDVYTAAIVKHEKVKEECALVVVSVDSAESITTPTTRESITLDDSDDEEEDEHFDRLGRWVPARLERDVALYNILAACAQPVIDFKKLLAGKSDFSEDDSDSNQSPPATLPSTQKLMAALQNADDVVEEDDTQMTTLAT